MHKSDPNSDNLSMNLTSQMLDQVSFRRLDVSVSVPDVTHDIGSFVVRVPLNRELGSLYPQQYPLQCHTMANQLLQGNYCQVVFNDICQRTSEISTDEVVGQDHSLQGGRNIFFE
ncbi:hypothetical protein J6590_066638 [Homalodisca vitripennis]|nr:hypothetical protein J6590_066638 [Homalodisca vitripennis]